MRIIRHGRWILPVTLLVLMGWYIWEFYGLHYAYKDGPEAIDKTREQVFRLGGLPEGYDSLQDVHYGTWRFIERPGPEFFVFKAERPIVQELISKWNLRLLYSGGSEVLKLRSQHFPPRLSKYVDSVKEPIEYYGGGGALLELNYSPSSRYCIIMMSYGT